MVNISNSLPERKCLISLISSDAICICIESASFASATSKLKNKETLDPASKSGIFVTPPKNSLCWWKHTVLGNPFGVENTCSFQFRVGAWDFTITLTPPPSTDSVAVSPEPAVNW